MQVDEELLTFQRFMLAFDTPAYLRRARQVEAEWEHLLALCARERERQLSLPRLRLAQLIVGTRAVDHAERLPVHEADRCRLIELYHHWQPKLRTRIPISEGPAAVRLAERLIESFAAFNRRWEKWLREVDLGPVNRHRDGYNRYYVLEKECAIRSERSAREGFEPLPMVTVDDLFSRFPRLDLPSMAR